MKNILSISFIILFITTFTSNALAFRCGTEIVDRWAPAATALNKCGYPFQKDFGYENIDGRIFYEKTALWLTPGIGLKFYFKNNIDLINIIFKII